MRKNLESLDQYRLNADGKAGTFGDGINDAMGHQLGTGEGLFHILMGLKSVAQVKSSELFGWDHLSIVTKEITKKGRTADVQKVRAPNYGEIMGVRELFFEDWEPVQIILPPPRSDANKYTVHLWRPQEHTKEEYAMDGTPIMLTPGMRERFDELHPDYVQSELSLVDDPSEKV